ncbi:vWA domain-containing protein [Neorhodopirellula pilleata]|uniref:von Willebrand factor type A domain protein n=1 Tax=Neorhodopirellula pilleata TaxID=2714738 RepID=A0A5C5ZF35_9BACT|nr:VWA domain-containing protein [Neorhodopirellula pilleata]TWT86059.1 von Willebrand factor type A domain protein [Neorhodopirellula pilleata]
MNNSGQRESHKPSSGIANSSLFRDSSLLRLCPTSKDLRRGVIVPLLAIMLPVLLMIAGFGIYLANAQLIRSELRTAVDFASRAGARKLSMEQSQAAAVSAAIDVASRNTIVGEPLALSPQSVRIGESRQRNGVNSRFEFTAGSSRPNSVQVTGSTRGNRGLTGFFSAISGVSDVEFTLPSTATNLDRDICLVIDRSGSMMFPIQGGFTNERCGPVPANSRFAALVRAVNVFINELNKTPQQELVCLASYSSNIVVRCKCCPRVIGSDPVTGDPIINPCSGVSSLCGGQTRYTYTFPEAQIHSTLSTNTAALLGPINQMAALGVAGATAIGSGLQQGIAAVKGAGSRPFAFPTIVLLTDGEHNEGTSPDIIAQQAKAENIVVHTITFSVTADQALMQKVAGITGGKHIHADDAGDLNAAFREIAQTLPVMLTN